MDELTAYYQNWKTPTKDWVKAKEIRTFEIQNKMDRPRSRSERNPTVTRQTTRNQRTKKAKKKTKRK